MLFCSVPSVIASCHMWVVGLFIGRGKTMRANYIKSAAVGFALPGLGVFPIYASQHESCGVDIENATPSGPAPGGAEFSFID
jgi:hypothetical protein